MSTWVIVEQTQDIAALQSIVGADAQSLVLGDEALAKTAAEAFAGVTWIDIADALPETFVNNAAKMLAETSPMTIAGVARPATRTIAGTVAVKLGMAVASNVVAATYEGDTLTVTRSVYNDYVEADAIAGAAVLLVNPLSVQGDAPSALHSAAPVETLAVAPSSFVCKTGEEEIEAVGEQTAKYVVGLGFGARSAESFAACHELARALDAEIGASMNMVENTPLMPGKRYIGLSGISIAPKLYVACGINGAVQHLAGVRNAACIAVVNSDPKAKFFDHANYGIVGTIEEVVPAIIRALG